MKQLWDKLRHGPISSQIVGGLILAGITALGAWVISADAKRLASDVATTLSAWLIAPVAMWVPMLVFVVAASLAGRLAVKRYREGREWTHRQMELEADLDAKTKELDSLRTRVFDHDAEIKKVQLMSDIYRNRDSSSRDKLASAEATIEALTAKLEPPQNLSFEPDNEQKAILNLLLHEYPSALTLSGIHQFTQYETPAHTEKGIQSLVDVKLLERQFGSSEYRYVLTTIGRDKAMEWCKRMRPRPRN